MHPLLLAFYDDIRLYIEPLTLNRNSRQRDTISLVGNFILGVIAAIWMFAFANRLPLTAIGYGAVPAILVLVYVFILREGKPKTFDRDLLKTLVYGCRWQQKPFSKLHPLFISLLLICPFIPGALHAQFMPGLYTDVKSEQNYEFTLVRDEPLGMIADVNFIWSQDGTPHTISIWVNDRLIDSVFHKWVHKGYEYIAGWAGRVIDGPLKAGTKVRLKARLDAPDNPSARLLSLAIRAVSYDSIRNLTDLEARVATIEQLTPQIGQNANKIAELSNQLSTLKTELNDFRQRLDAFGIDHSQFKTETNHRLSSLDTRVTSIENNLKNVSQQLNAQRVASDQFKAQVSSRFNAIDQTVSDLDTKLADHYKTLKDQDAEISNAHRAESDQLKAHIGSRFNAIDQTVSDLDTKLADHYKTLKDQDAEISNAHRAESDQLKAHIGSRFNAIDQTVSDLDTKLADHYKTLKDQDAEISNAHRAESDQLKAHIGSRFNAIDQTVSDLDTKLADHYKTLKDQDAEISNAHRAESDQLKAQVASHFGAVDQAISGLDAKISSLKNHSKALRDQDAAVLDDRLATLEKHQQSLFHRRPNNLLGIIGTSVGGTAALLAGGAFYQLLKNEEQQRISLKQSKNGNASEWRDFKDVRLEKIPNPSKTVPKKFK